MNLIKLILKFFFVLLVLFIDCIEVHLILGILFYFQIFNFCFELLKFLNLHLKERLDIARVGFRNDFGLKLRGGLTWCIVFVLGYQISHDFANFGENLIEIISLFLISFFPFSWFWFWFLHGGFVWHKFGWLNR